MRLLFALFLLSVAVLVCAAWAILRTIRKRHHDPLTDDDTHQPHP